nr:hirudin variant HV1 [Whitmania pigra]
MVVSLKVFVVFFAVCICVYQALHYIDCTETGQNLCLCEGDNACVRGDRCILGSTKKDNKCIPGYGKAMHQNKPDEESEQFSYDDDDDK